MSTNLAQDAAQIRKVFVDRVIEKILATDCPGCLELADEIIIMRSMYGDEETQKWLVIQSSVNRLIHFR